MLSCEDKEALATGGGRGSAVQSRRRSRVRRRGELVVFRLTTQRGRGGATLDIVSLGAVFPTSTEGIYGSARAALVNPTRIHR